MSTTPQYTRANAPAVYEWEGPTGVKFRDVKEASGCYYHDTTPRRVVALLERFLSRIGGRQTVRLFYGDKDTGRDWLEEHDMVGSIGMSTGWHAIPLLVPRGADGGCGILTDCIVKIMVDGLSVYQHPLYKKPETKAWNESVHPDCPWAVDVNGDKTHARFKTEAKATRWAAFIRGDRMTK